MAAQVVAAIAARPCGALAAETDANSFETKERRNFGGKLTRSRGELEGDVAASVRRDGMTWLPRLHFSLMALASSLLRESKGFSCTVLSALIFGYVDMRDNVS